jgi:hypothetical protein
MAAKITRPHADVNGGLTTAGRTGKGNKFNSMNLGKITPSGVVPELRGAERGSFGQSRHHSPADQWLPC